MLVLTAVIGVSSVSASGPFPLLMKVCGWSP